MADVDSIKWNHIYIYMFATFFLWPSVPSGFQPCQGVVCRKTPCLACILFEFLQNGIEVLEEVL